MVVSFPKSLAWFCLNSLQIFISALVASILYLLVFLRLRGIVRARAPSTSIASAKEELHDKYEHRLARQMLLYPVCIQSTARPSHLTRVSQIAYTIMIIPITTCRFLAWSGRYVPFSATIFRCDLQYSLALVTNSLFLVTLSTF